MTKKYSTKRSLVASILILCLCFTSFVGTTFAWFTDEVTSSGNKIVSGSLKVDLKLFDKDNGWSSLKESKAPIFNYQNWEPGYIDAKLLKVDNEGTLALKWKAKFVSNEELGILADVIDVYVLPYGVLSEADAAAKVEYPDRNLENYTKVGTVRDFVNTIESTTYGELKAKESAYLGIALKMQESAGNAYQMQSIGAFDIQIVATQLASEEDSFGKDYDEGAQFPGEVGSVDELIAALSNNENVRLSGDIDLSGIEWTPIALYSGILDGNGYAIKNLKGENGLFNEISGATVKNLKLENVDIDATSYHTGALAGYAIKNSEKQTVIENVTVSGSVNGSGYYTGGIIGADSNYSTFISGCVNNATVVGGSNYTGGILGYATRESIIDSCTNNGNVSGESFVGGIVGLAAGDDELPDHSITISNCVNTGNVEVTNTATGWADCVGGIAGAVGRAGGDTPKVELSYFVYGCTVLDGQKTVGRKYNVATGKDEFINLADVVEVSNVDELQVALDAVTDSTVIRFVADMEGDSIVTQPEGKLVKVVIDGAGYKYYGSIQIYGLSSSELNDTLAIRNINFETSSATSENGRDAFVWSYDTKSDTIRYAHNITVENCTFTVIEGSPAQNNFAGVKVGQAYNVTVRNCVATNAHSLVQAESIDTYVTVEGCKAINCKSGVSFNNTKKATIKNSELESVVDGGYGIRHKGQVKGYSLTVESCTIKAFVPVLIRNMTASGYTAAFNGTNSLTATNSFGYEVVVSGGDWDNDSALPANPTGSYTLNGADGLVVFEGTKVYDSSMGDLYDYLPTLKSGDVLVLPGRTYTVSGSLSVPAGVTIKAKDGETVIFHQQSSAQDDLFNCAGDVTFINITFETNRKGYAITYKNQDHSIDGDITVIGCTFKGLASEKNWGVYKNVNGNLTVIDCTFENYDNAICGVNNQNGSATVISGCTFTNIKGEAIGYVKSSVPADFEAEVIANNTGLTEENVIGY